MLFSYRALTAETSLFSNCYPYVATQFYCMLEVKSNSYRIDMSHSYASYIYVIRYSTSIAGDATRDETPVQFREINCMCIMSCAAMQIRNYTTDFKRRNYNWYSHLREAIHALLFDIRIVSYRRCPRTQPSSSNLN